ncbi:MAG: hypothetical protein EOO41_04700, partial [Methanobacteriota archaeon]
MFPDLDAEQLANVSAVTSFIVPHSFSTFLFRYATATARVQQLREAVHLRLSQHKLQYTQAAGAFVPSSSAPLAQRALNVSFTGAAHQFALAEAMSKTLTPVTSAAQQLQTLPSPSASLRRLSSSALESALESVLASREAACASVGAVNASYVQLAPRILQLLDATRDAAEWMDAFADARNQIMARARAQRLRLGGADGERLLSDAGLSGSLVRSGAVRPLQAGLVRTGFASISDAFEAFQSAFVTLVGSQDQVSSIEEQAAQLLAELLDATDAKENMRALIDTLATMSDEINDLPAEARVLQTAAAAALPTFTELPQVPDVVNSIANIGPPLGALIRGLDVFNASTYARSQREPLQVLTQRFRDLVAAVDAALPGANVSVAANELSMALYAFRDTHMK